MAVTNIVILTNQAGLYDPQKDAPIATKFKIEAAAVLDTPNTSLKLYAATARDSYREPRTGMWDEMVKDYQLDDNRVDLNLTASYLMGDSAECQGDHSDFAVVLVSFC